MKIKIFLGLIMLISFLGMNALFAQSDYSIVQNFKENVQKIQTAIQNADSLAVLDQITDKIDNLQNEFTSHKELLDKSLYPANFNGTIEQLKNFDNLRKNDFSQIDVLNTKMSDLSKQVDTLNQHNNDLETQLTVLENQNKQNEKMVSQLRSSLMRRDQIVMAMINNIVPSTSGGNGELNQMEKQKLYSNAEKDNIVLQIKRAVNDNIRFLEATKLYSDDLNKIEIQRQKFVQTWDNVGPLLVKIYSEKNKSTENLKDINQSFALWKAKINQEAWNSINSEFANNNFQLAPFTNGDEFTSSVTSFIDDAIKNVGETDKADAEHVYKTFVDSTWNKYFKYGWAPFLVNNNMINKKQISTIDAKIADWSNAVYPEGFNWFYVIAAVLFVAVIFLLFVVRSERKTIKHYHLQEQRQ
jgi:hypothetical protein